MIRIIYGNSSEGREYLNSLKERAEEVQRDVVKTVDRILEDVRQRGDEAVAEYTKRFDSSCVNSSNFIVSREEIDDAYGRVDDGFLRAIKKAMVNIRAFHEKQKRNSFIDMRENGVIMGQTIRGLEKVGLYVPGGTASYPSSVMMNAIPAKAAGVKKLFMATPPNRDGSIDPNILVAADLSGVDKIFKMGGAQAVGALAFGTESVPKVDKIVGPGNIYVATAKRSVYGYVDIDMIAGPSEILVIADENANPRYLAADLMSQAEHDELASSILVTTSPRVAEEVKAELERQVEGLSRKDIIKSSMENYGAIIIVDNLEEAVRIANRIAPEHLELVVDDPFLLLGEISNAGSIFLGECSPEPVGDYFAGPNHVLPTSGTARFFSPLSLDDFIKKQSYLYYSRRALEESRDDIIKLAETEGLTAHANSIRVRFE